MCASGITARKKHVGRRIRGAARLAGENLMGLGAGHMQICCVLRAMDICAAGDEVCSYHQKSRLQYHYARILHLANLCLQRWV